MKVSELCEKYLTEYATDLRAPRSYRHCVAMWERNAPKVHIRRIDIDTFAKFRKNATDAGLAPRTIESCIGRVHTLLKYAFEVRADIDRVPPRGRRLKVMRTPPIVPTLEEVSAMYENAGAAIWPEGIHITPGEFYRCFIVAAFFTGLRCEDLVCRLKWEHVRSDGIYFQAGKTGKLHTFPIHKVLGTHLDRLRGPSERLFPKPRTPAFHQFRRELKRICRAAKVRTILPQDMRRLAFNAHERAETGSGQLLLGHSMGVSDFYAAKVPDNLISASAKLLLPSAFTDEPQMLPTSAPIYAPASLGPEWEFEPGRFGFRGRFHPLRAEALRVLRLLVDKGRPCTFREIAAVAYSGAMPTDEHLQRRRAIAATCRLRHQLRECLGISKAYHVVVTVDRGAEPAWTIHLPDSAIREADAAAAANRIRKRRTG